jgi:hypothetical protein
MGTNRALCFLSSCSIDLSCSRSDSSCARPFCIDPAEDWGGFCEFIFALTSFMFILEVEVLLVEVVDTTAALGAMGAVVWEVIWTRVALLLRRTGIPERVGTFRGAGRLSIDVDRSATATAVAATVAVVVRGTLLLALDADRGAGAELSGRFLATAEEDKDVEADVEAEGV